MKLPTLLVLFRSITPSDEEVRLGIFACDRSFRFSGRSLKQQLDSNHVPDNKEDVGTPSSWVFF